MLLVEESLEGSVEEGLLDLGLGLPLLPLVVLPMLLLEEGLLGLLLLEVDSLVVPLVQPLVAVLLVQPLLADLQVLLQVVVALGLLTTIKEVVDSLPLAAIQQEWKTTV